MRLRRKRRRANAARKQEATMQHIANRVLSTLLALTISGTLFSAVLV